MFTVLSYLWAVESLESESGSGYMEGVLVADLVALWNFRTDFGDWSVVWTQLSDRYGFILVLQMMRFSHTCFHVSSSYVYRIARRVPYFQCCYSCTSAYCFVLEVGRLGLKVEQSVARTALALRPWSVCPRKWEGAAEQEEYVFRWNMSSFPSFPLHPSISSTNRSDNSNGGSIY